MMIGIKTNFLFLMIKTINSLNNSNICNFSYKIININSKAELKHIFFVLEDNR